MMDDEKQTASTAAHVIGRDIASMSVDELERTIDRLREEIARMLAGEHVTADVRLRIGDVVAAATGSAGMLRKTVEPVESSLVGQHGSLTSAEQRIPLLLAHH